MQCTSVYHSPHVVSNLVMGVINFSSTYLPSVCTKVVESDICLTHSSVVVAFISFPSSTLTSASVVAAVAVTDSSSTTSLTVGDLAASVFYSSSTTSLTKSDLFSVFGSVSGSVLLTVSEALTIVAIDILVAFEVVGAKAVELVVTLIIGLFGVI